MFGLDDVAEGAAIGVGALAVGAVALIGAPRAKPLAKQAIKGYLAVTERARGALAEAGERVQDIYAEAKVEYDSEAQGRPAAEHYAAPSPDMSGEGPRPAGAEA